jgi:DNA polymerase III epsilon subunit family exonuclease
MKDRIYRYLLKSGGEASTKDVLRRCAGVVWGAGAVEEPLLGWIASDPRFEKDGEVLRLADGHADPDRLPIDEAIFVVVDLETTGTRGGDSITEIGAVRMRGGIAEESWSTLVNPGVKIPGQITRLTGIHDAMLEGQPSIAEALPVFLEFLGDSVLVAHNAPFDLGFLRRARQALQGMDLPNRVLCTVRMARTLMPRLRSRNLDSLALHLGIEVPGRHRALGDATATARILAALLERAEARGDRTVGDLARYSGI